VGSKASRIEYCGRPVVENIRKSAYPYWCTISRDVETQHSYAVVDLFDISQDHSVQRLLLILAFLSTRQRVFSS
jgi:hypothetical protein